MVTFLMATMVSSLTSRHDPLGHGWRWGRASLIPWISIIDTYQSFMNQPFLHLKREFLSPPSLGAGFHSWLSWLRWSPKWAFLTLSPTVTKAGYLVQQPSKPPLQWTFNDITRWSNRRLGWCWSFFHCTLNWEGAETTGLTATAAGAGTWAGTSEAATYILTELQFVRSIFIRKFSLKLDWSPWSHQVLDLI